MKKILAIILVLITAVLIFFFILGYKSQTGAALGLMDNKLQACPDTPNCVLSEADIVAEFYIDPLDIGNYSTAAAIEKITTLILASGGEFHTD